MLQPQAIELVSFKWALPAELGSPPGGSPWEDPWRPCLGDNDPRRVVGEGLGQVSPPRVQAEGW